MVAYPKHSHYTPEQYLDLELESETRSEYVAGTIVAMSGSSHNHNTISKNALLALEASVRKSGCESFIIDMRVKIDAADSYYYPDYMVACGKRELITYRGTDSLTNPTLVLEVLSKSTEQRDRGEKWLAYREIESLQVYILVHQDRPILEMYVRTDEPQTWSVRVYQGLDAVAPIELLGANVALAQLYADVVFPAVRGKKLKV